MLHDIFDQHRNHFIPLIDYELKLVTKNRRLFQKQSSERWFEIEEKLRPLSIVPW